MAKLSIRVPYDKVQEVCWTMSALLIPASAICSGANSDVCITYSVLIWQVQAIMQRLHNSDMHSLLQFYMHGGRFNVTVGGTTTTYTNMAFDPQGNGLYFVFDNTYTFAHAESCHVIVGAGMVDITRGPHVLQQALAEVQYLASLDFKAHGDGVTRVNCLIMSSTLLKALVPDTPSVLASKAMR